MSLIRIVDCTSQLYSDSYVMNVEILSNDPSDDVMYMINVPQAFTYTVDDLKRFIEQYIRNQQQATPNFKGMEWRTDSV